MKSWLGEVNWKPWKNTGYATVGPWELIELSGVEDYAQQIIRDGEQPTSDTFKVYGVNGPVSVAQNETGIYQPGPEVLVAYDNSGLPAAGELWGPKNGQGKASKDSSNPCLKIIGVYNAANKLTAARFQPISIRRAKLLADLHQCGSVQAELLRDDDNSGCLCDARPSGTVITLIDAIGLAANNDVGFVPAGELAYVYAHAPPIWWPLAFGVSNCGSSNSSANSSSQSSGSGPSGSGPSGSGGSGSDKSTAIVPASWSPSGYTALFIAECPEVRFDDVMTVVMDKTDTTFPIDARFVEVCERGSIKVCGCVPDLPVLIGASVEPRRPDALEAVRVRIAGTEQWPVRVTIRLTGIRRGFLGHRFPNRTREQFEANERFIRSAYPDEH